MFIVNGKPRALPAHTINPLWESPPSMMADRADVLFDRLCGDGYVPDWQWRAAWWKVRYDANRTPGFNDIDLATAKCLWRREHQDKRFSLHCPFAPSDHTWGWRAVMHAYRALSILKAARTIPPEKRLILHVAYRDAIHRWDMSARVHASGYGVKLPARRRDEANNPFRTEFSPVPVGVSEAEWRGPSYHAPTQMGD